MSRNDFSTQPFILICQTRKDNYVKCGESTIITTKGRIFSLHHSATISYHFDKIFTPNALEMTLLSNDVKLHANDWTFLKLSAVERETDNIFCEISSLMTSNSPHFISTSISVLYQRCCFEFRWGKNKEMSVKNLNAANAVFASVLSPSH